MQQQPAITRKNSADMHVPVETVPGTVLTAKFLPATPGKNDDELKPHTVRVKGGAKEARLTPVNYFGSSPWKHKIGGPLRSGSRAFAAPPSMLLHRLTRSSSAMATVNVNKTTVSAGKTTANVLAALNLNHVHTIGQQTIKQSLPGMHSHSLLNAEENVMQLPPLLPMMSIQGGIPNHLALQRTETFDLADRVKNLRSTTARFELRFNEHNEVLAELVSSTKEASDTAKRLTERMEILERENARLSSMIRDEPIQEYSGPRSAPAVHSQSLRLEANGRRSRSPSPARLDRSYRERSVHEPGETDQKPTLRDSRRTKVRKQLQIEIPGAIPQSSAGLPTPLSRTATSLSASMMSSMMSSLPKTPITPGRIGPSNVNKRSATSMNKRKNHSLDKMLPPAYVLIPHLPLTDTEVIVYFFQSLSRPSVALRLYAREWGPRNIVDALHSHRLIEPPYLRNTCSVKCTTAIKMGKRKYGDDWEETCKLKMKGASDECATDFMRLSPEERELAYDYDVRSLCVGLTKHPEEGVDGGIFTRCVKYCQQFNAAYTIHNLWQLADDLEAGRTPTHPEPRKDFAIGAHGGCPLVIKDQDGKDESGGLSEATPTTPEGMEPDVQRSLSSTPECTIPRPSTPDSVVSEGNDETQDTA